MINSFGRQKCPFCGASLKGHSPWCDACRLSIPTYRAIVPVDVSREFQRRNLILSESRTFQLLMCLMVFFFRLSLEAPAFALVDAANLLGMGAIITKFGGVIGGIVAVGAMLALEYLFVDPVFQLGVKEWNGVFETFFLYATVACVGAFILCMYRRHRSAGPFE